MNKMIKRTTELNKILEEKKEIFQVIYCESTKNNQVLKGYCLKSKNHNCSPTIYYSSDWFDKSDIDVACFLSEFFHDHTMNLNIDFISSKNYILEHVKPRLMSNTNLNSIIKSDYCYSSFLNMLIVYYVPIKMNSDGLNGSFILTNKTLESTGLSFSNICTSALLNQSQDIQVIPMNDVLAELMGEVLLPPDPVPCMLVLSNESRVNGASVILCEKTIDKVKSILGNHFAVLPSSTHECIAVPIFEDSNISELQEIVMEINMNEVDIQDKLTDSVYIFNNNMLTMFVNE